MHNGILFSHKKEWNNAICSNRMDLGIIIISEVSQKEDDKYNMIFITYKSKILTDTNYYV